jgi:hypothetical protein
LGAFQRPTPSLTQTLVTDVRNDDVLHGSIIA